MSLETGRKLGLTASLLNIIVPVVAIAIVIASIASAIISIASRATSGTVPPTFLGLGLGIIILLVAIVAMGIVAFILFMVAMRNLSHYYNEPAIFKNVLYAFLINIINGVVAFVLYIGIFIFSIGTLPTTTPPNNPTAILTGAILGYIAVLAVAFVLGILNGYLYMRAFNKLKDKSGVDSFGTAGILYLIGAIIPFIAWIAWIFAAIGFNRLKPAPVAQTTYTQPPQTYMQTKRCPNCGTENTADALYCRNCGKPL